MKIDKLLDLSKLGVLCCQQKFWWQFSNENDYDMGLGKKKNAEYTISNIFSYVQPCLKKSIRKYSEKFCMHLEK